MLALYDPALLVEKHILVGEVEASRLSPTLRIKAQPPVYITPRLESVTIQLMKHLSS
jgi:hypothetical protein